MLNYQRVFQPPTSPNHVRCPQPAEMTNHAAAAIIRTSAKPNLGYTAIPDLVNIQKANWKIAIEIVSCPMNSMMIFQFVM